MVTTGARFLKFFKGTFGLARSGHRVVWVSPDLQSVLWRRSALLSVSKEQHEPPRGFPLVTCTSIEKGTACFPPRAAAREECSFSILAGSWALHLEAETEKIRNQWVNDLLWAREFVSGSLVSSPYNLEHVEHVGVDWTWGGGRPLDLVFELLEQVGKGAYGSVYKVKHKQIGFILAAKISEPSTMTRSRQISDSKVESAKGKIEGRFSSDSFHADEFAGDWADLRNEIAVLKACRHKGIVSYYGSGIDSLDRFWILMDFCDGGSIMGLLEKPRRELFIPKTLATKVSRSPRLGKISELKRLSARFSCDKRMSAPKVFGLSTTMSSGDFKASLSDVPISKLQRRANGPLDLAFRDTLSALEMEFLVSMIMCNVLQALIYLQERNIVQSQRLQF
jgi:hypothetical protein